MDLIYLLIIALFFVIAVAYVFGCARLNGGENE